MAPRPGRIATWLDTWPGRITAILTLVATVIGLYVAIKGLLPGPDAESRAGIADVALTQDIPLSEYKARADEEGPSAQVRPVGGGGGVAVIEAAPLLVAQASTATTSTQEPATGTTSTQPPTSTEQPTTTTTPTEATTPTTKAGRRIPVLPDQPSISSIAKARPAAQTINSVVLPDNTQAKAFRVESNKVLDSTAARTDIDTCSSAQASGNPCDAILPLITAASTSTRGGQVSAQEVEDRLADLLRHTRTVVGGNGKRVPVGVEVAFVVALEGLRGADVYIRWSIHEAGSKHRLFGKWLATNVAYKLKVNSDNTTRSRDIWVPLPRTSGPFFVRLYVASEGDILSFRDTGRFG